MIHLTIGDMVRIGYEPQVWRIVAERLKAGGETVRHPQGDQWVEYQLEAKLPGAMRTTRVWHEAEKLRLVTP
jgi:hypothetical protein